jgi:hypothetical protein
MVVADPAAGADDSLTKEILGVGVEVAVSVGVKLAVAV